MAGKRSLSALLATGAVAVILIIVASSAGHAYRICTFKGTVIDNGWRTMTVKSNGQCAQVNVGWRTKYIPNRRPCLGERVAVDFALEDGYMKATKVVSLSPVPAAVECYPPPPPGSAVCRSVAAETTEAPCASPKPICSPKPPSHVTDSSWAPTPVKKKPAATKPGVKKPVTPTDEGGVSKPVEEPTAPAKEETRKVQPPITEKKFKTLAGEVVASSPKSLSIRVTEEGETAEVVSVSVGLKTKFIPFRRPAVGEKVKVDYREENGGKFGYTVQVTQ